MDDPCGRWFSFTADPRTVMVLEKGKLAEHLAGLPCVESPTYLTTILRELEDAGEVRGINLCCTMKLLILLWGTNTAIEPLDLWSGKVGAVAPHHHLCGQGGVRQALGILDGPSEARARERWETTKKEAAEIRYRSRFDC